MWAEFCDTYSPNNEDNNSFEEEIIKYLNELKEKRLFDIETEDFSKVQSVRYGYERDVQALEIVIEIIKNNIYI